jgi:hypothetical protein
MPGFELRLEQIAIQSARALTLRRSLNPRIGVDVHIGIRHVAVESGGCPSQQTTALGENP